MAEERAYLDSQQFNNSFKNARTYSDLDLFFSKKTDGDINTIRNFQAVKRSIRHLILYNRYEKPFHPEIPAGITEMLFENMTPITANILARKIELLITQYEPRAIIDRVIVSPDLDDNSYHVSIYFFVKNAPTELQQLDFMLERLR